MDAVGTRRLSGRELAAAIGVTPNRREDWARSRLLRQAQPGDGYGALDAVQLACLSALIDAAGQKRAKQAWPAVRQALLDAVPTGRIRRWAIIDMSVPVQVVARSAATAIQAASAATGQVCVVALHEVSEQALSRFRLAAQSLASEPPGTDSIVADIGAARVTDEAGSPSV